MASAPSQPPARPLSHWAERFGTIDGHSILSQPDQVHSGRAAEHPRLDPKYYDARPKPIEYSWPASNVELDRFFYSEAWQRQRLSGPRSWECAPLNSTLSFSVREHAGQQVIISGGHRPVDVGKEDDLMSFFDSERFDIDETTWLSCFQRTRRYEMRQLNTVTGSWWTVDNPQIWDVLSVSLELANRILRALITDRHDWIETLLITVAKWCSIYFNLAVTMLHELMHKILDSRYHDSSTYAKYTVSVVDTKEPFVDFEVVREIGDSFENAVFGGLLGAKPEGAPMVMRLSDWPNRSNTQDRLRLPFDLPCFQKGSKLVISLVPAMYASKLLSREFWNDTKTPNKSSDLFQMPKGMIKMRATNNSTGCDYNGITIDEDMAKKGPYGPIVQKWQGRQQRWEQFRRHWYPKAHQAWVESPWSDVDAHEAIDKFSTGFAKKDEARCAEAAQPLTNRVPWNERVKYLNSPPFPGKAGRQAPWLFHCIGLLMRAALPIRSRTMSEDRVWAISDVFYSSANVNNAINSGGKVVFPGSIGTDHTATSAYTIEVPVGPGGMVWNNTPMEWLNLAEQTLADVRARNCEVSSSWVAALSDALKRTRTDLARGGRDGTKWATFWPFVIPDYLPDDWTT
ncbi:Uu.00g049500.m01.CDS01 [Anthostomella pinea]|uniref:Uu.00g049500.m01.CDS01 n=1 Tax=Anthostomella pinea TaxID=933095 RepID=A0AAI8YET5_9PEZI|nr:Uu.00g049500.m01.CDS01 [Anthostomella pinea]